MLASITNPAAVRVYGEIAKILPPHQQVTIKNVKYTSPNKQGQGGKTTSHLTLEKQGENNIQVSLVTPLSSQTTFGFNGKINLEVEPTTQEEILSLSDITSFKTENQLTGITGTLSKSNPMYLKGQKEIEAALTETNLARLWKKLTSGIKSSPKGFGK